ncbi:pentapeptide repeat-containing protein [Parashewanella spongiae]|uniref:pentapeptide repeat-containing protein n=1 Tax=Parashewanella spongiae TaxID=342950 RepID=UPI0014772996|nr:pentapeptide repeat-containing protein [Parashewanella spongiae]
MTKDPVALFKTFVELRLYASKDFYPCFQLKIINGLVEFEFVYSKYLLPSSEIPYKKIRLEDIDLSSWELTGIDLSEAYLTRANLSRCVLGNMSLTNCCLFKANCCGMNAHRVSMQCTLLVQADLREAVFSNINARNVILRGANCSAMQMQDVSMVGARLSNTVINDANLLRVDMSNAQANQSPLHCLRTKFIDCELNSAQLPSADLSHSCLAKCRLEKASLVGARMRGINLERAWLKETEMINVDLKWANLFDINAESIIAWGANFEGVNAELADFSFGRFFSYSESVPTSFTNANLKNAYFLGADLHCADFRGADLTNANFTGANLTEANFDGAILDGAVFSYADCTGGNFNNASMKNFEANITQWHNASMLGAKIVFTDEEEQETIVHENSKPKLEDETLDNVMESSGGNTATSVKSIVKCPPQMIIFEVELDNFFDELVDESASLQHYDSGLELDEPRMYADSASLSMAASVDGSLAIIPSRRKRASSSLSSEVDSFYSRSASSNNGASLEELKGILHAEMTNSTLKQQLLEAATKSECFEEEQSPYST